MTKNVDTGHSRYLKFQGTKKFTLRYQQFEIKKTVFQEGCEQNVLLNVPCQNIDENSYTLPHLSHISRI